jgi:hypothetical protein
MIIFKKIRKNTDIKNVLNHDVQEQKVNNRSYQKGSKKGLEDKYTPHIFYVDDTY